jgi:membrane fusion protein, multidrug efflux system
MEAGVEVADDRKRYVISSIIVITLVVTIALAMMVTMKKKSGKAGGGAAVGAAVTGTASASAADDKKKNGNGKEKAPIPVSVVPVSLAPISSYLSSTANLVAENEVKIVSETEGKVAELLVEEGDVVRKGAVLARVVRDEEQIVLAKARVRAANAGVNYERAREMNEKQLLSRSDYDKAKMENEVARQELAEAEWRVSRTTIRAPFGGRVTERLITPGQHVAPGALLFTITDYDPLIARIYVPEKDVLGLEEGRPVRITLKAAQDVVFTGRIRQISPVVDASTGTVKLTIEAVQPPASVRPGSFVTVDIVKETRSGAVVLPKEAVVRELRDAHVFVVKGSAAEKRVVTLGLEESGRVEAVSGVKAGEQIIVAGQGGLKDGSVIKVLPPDGGSEI